MSLVGNLADLGLADIFQIVAMSGRSGALRLSCRGATAEIVFNGGRVVAAFRSDAPLGAGEHLMGLGLITAGLLQELLGRAKAGVFGAELLEEVEDRDRVDEALKELLSEIVYSLFDWDEGTFSFVLEKSPDPWTEFDLVQARAVYADGLNPQFLAMEGARLKDERTSADSLTAFLARDKPQQPSLGKLLAPPDDIELPPQRLTAEASPPPTPTPAPKLPSLAPPGIAGEDDFGALDAEPSEPRGESKSESKVVAFPVSRPPSDGALESAGERSGDTRARKRALQSDGFEVLVVDDDPDVLAVLERRLARYFRQVHRATRVGEAMRFFENAPARLVVVADLIMPRTDGRGILGGLELLARARALESDAVFIIFSDFANEAARLEADELGAVAFLSKPRRSAMTDSKGQPSEVFSHFVDSLEEIVGAYGTPSDEKPLSPSSEGSLEDALADDLDEIVEKAERGLPPRVEAAEQMSLLQSMLSELVNPSNRETVTLLVLRYAGFVVERAALFLPAKGKFVGLGGFDSTGSNEHFVARIRKTQISGESDSVIEKAVRYRALMRGPLEKNSSNEAMVERIGGAWPEGEVFAAPLVSGSRVAAVLYGDNPSGKSLGPTEGLEIFLQQAGLAMDRALLERRLADSRESRSDDR